MTGRGIRAAAAAGTLAILAACSGGGGGTLPSSPMTGVSSSTASPAIRVEGWRQDLDTLLERAAELHPDLADGVPERLQQDADDLGARAATLDDDQLMVGVMHLATQIPANGRDGHTGLYVWGQGNRPVHSLPLRVWFFADGLYVEDQLGGNDLVGDRIVGISGHELSEVLPRLDEVVPHDNASTVLALRPRFLLTPEVLHGLGLLGEVGAVSLDVVGSDGHRKTVTVEPVPIDQYNGWAGPYGLTLVPRGEAPSGSEPVLSHRLLGRTLYVAYRGVEHLDEAELRAVERLTRSHAVDRVVVDIRQNLGGEVGEEAPLLDILTDPRVAKPGRLYLLSGRNTFSAASLFAAELQRRASVTVVGEAMGGAPASFGNSEPVHLEHSGLVVSVASSREGDAGDRRETITPDVAVALSSRDYFAGRDPVLDAARRGER